MAVDETELALQFDQGRRLSSEKEKLWLGLFEQHLVPLRGSQVLDIGCGTGRFAISMALHLQCTVVGVDPSLTRLAIAKQKGVTDTLWLMGRAEAIPCASDAFDACLASQMIHHFQDKRQAFQELQRILHVGGRIGIRSSSHTQLAKFLDYRFFPSALAIDLERMPDLPVIRTLLAETGFSGVEEHIVLQPIMESPEDYIAKLRNKYSSVLHRISGQEYRQGLESAANYMQSKLTDTDKYAEISFIVGVKR